MLHKIRICFGDVLSVNGIQRTYHGDRLLYCRGNIPGHCSSLVSIAQLVESFCNGNVVPGTHLVLFHSLDKVCQIGISTLTKVFLNVAFHACHIHHSGHIVVDGSISRIGSHGTNMRIGSVEDAAKPQRSGGIVSQFLCKAKVFQSCKIVHLIPVPRQMRF